MSKAQKKVFLILALAPIYVAAAKSWLRCRDKVHSIQNGTLTITGKESGEPINRDNIDQYIWDGVIALLRNTVNRTSILAVNYDGCIEICGEETRWLDAESALAIVTTWIFPLSILFSLPFESDKRRTITSLVNWIGSPPITMTETLYNTWQTLQAYRHQCGRYMPSNEQWDEDVALASSYVLSCLNQYKMPGITPLPENKNGTPLRNVQGPPDTLTVLQNILYGLYRPLDMTIDPNRPTDAEQITLTRSLILVVAHQLRQQRRRGVVPIVCTMVIFVAAFVFSIVLAFIADADATVTPLTLGLLYSWMPVMVMFTVVDRNPHSTDRSSELLQRWLYNVSYVRHSRTAAFQRGPRGWVPRGPRGWWTSPLDAEREFELAFDVKDFIGQGRTGESCSLALAILKATSGRRSRELYTSDTASLVNSYLFKERRKDVTFVWLTTACISFFLFWFFILMAFTVAYNSPTAGLGCWSGSFLVYAFLSSVAWFLRVARALRGLVFRPSYESDHSQWTRRARLCFDALCFLANSAAVVTLLLVTIVVLTGIIDNCWCATTWIFSQYDIFTTGGYQAFDNPETRILEYTIVEHWVPPTTFALTVLISSGLGSLFAWKRCQKLWKPLPKERRIPDPRVNLAFLQ